MTLALILPGLAVAYWISLKVKPMTKCRQCGGSKRQPRLFSGIWSYGFSACTRCRGSGQKVRFGVRLTDRERAARLRQSWTSELKPRSRSGWR